VVAVAGAVFAGVFVWRNRALFTGKARARRRGRSDNART
jgi:hypothetical protein